MTIIFELKQRIKRYAFEVQLNIHLSINYNKNWNFCLAAPIVKIISSITVIFIWLDWMHIDIQIKSNINVVYYGLDINFTKKIQIKILGSLKIIRRKLKLKSTKSSIFLFALKVYLLTQGFYFPYQYAIAQSLQYLWRRKLEVLAIELCLTFFPVLS